MQHAQPMLLDLEELLVDVENLSRTSAGLQDQPLFGVSQHLFEVALLTHGAHNTGQRKCEQVEMPCLQVVWPQATVSLPNCPRASVDSAPFWGIVHRLSNPSRRGAKMTLRHRKSDPLADVFRSQQEEIKKYKWIESEKVGRDIGWERAA
jgi:hypothetical protein